MVITGRQALELAFGVAGESLDDPAHPPVIV